MARTREVALVIGTNNHFNRSIVTGIGRYSRKAGHWVTYVEDEPALKVPDFRTWTGHGIIADLDDIRVARAVSRMKIPVVGLGGFSDATVLDVNVPYVATDDDAIGRMGAEHLMGRGLRNFAYCGVPRTRCNTW
jgi:LacI family transcriptional regulator